MHTRKLVLVRSIFFIWGFATILNTTVAYYFKNLLFLNFNVTTLVQFSYYFAYAVFSIPAGRILRRFGYKVAIESGLLTSSFGSFLFVLFSKIDCFYLNLLSLFAIATGTVLLQVSLNPYIIAVSKKAQDTKNLNIAQAFNSLGTVFAPLVAAIFVFGENVISRKIIIERIYICLGIFLILQAIFFRNSDMPHIDKPNMRRSLSSVKKYPHLIRGAIAIFFYVGAEVGVGFAYWFLAMVGRFCCPLFLRFIGDKKLLATYAISATISLIALLFFPIAPLVIILPIIGFFNSIMFPTIFALSIRKLKTFTPLGAGIICFSVVGGAILPKIQGYLADIIGVQYSFIVPLISYL